MARGIRLLASSRKSSILRIMGMAIGLGPIRNAQDTTSSTIDAAGRAVFQTSHDSSILGRMRPPFARRKSERVAKGSRELARRAETRRECDLDHGERCLAQQMPGAIQAQLEIVLVDAAANMAPKRAFELSERHSCEAGKPLPRQWLFEIFFHGLEHRENAFIGNAQPEA